MACLFARAQNDRRTGYHIFHRQPRLLCYNACGDEEGGIGQACVQIVAKQQEKCTADMKQKLRGRFAIHRIPVPRSEACLDDFDTRVTLAPPDTSTPKSIVTSMGVGRRKSPEL